MVFVASPGPMLIRSSCCYQALPWVSLKCGRFSNRFSVRLVSRTPPIRPRSQLIKAANVKKSGIGESDLLGVDDTIGDNSSLESLILDDGVGPMDFVNVDLENEDEDGADLEPDLPLPNITKSVEEVLVGSSVPVVSIEGDAAETIVSGLQSDSRLINPGDIFVAVKGTKVDGHEFIVDAVEAGATAVIFDSDVEIDLGPWAEDVVVVKVINTQSAISMLAGSFWDHPSRYMTAIGVTGTNGKTTTANILRTFYVNALESSCAVLGTICNEFTFSRTIDFTQSESEYADSDENEVDINNASANISEEDGKPSQSVIRLDSSHTTGDATQLQETFAAMRELDINVCVMEVSSHALDQRRTDGIDFDIAVYTNLTRDHLDYHGSVENYKRAKLRLFQSLHDPFRQRAIINLDDEHAQDFCDASYKVPKVTYSLSNPRANVYAVTVENTLFDTAVLIQTPHGPLEAVTVLLGKTNVMNILAAVSVGIATSMPLAAIAAGIESIAGVAGRFELVDLGQPFAVVVDYAHSPDGLENLLRAVQDLKPNRIVTVFGCGGDRDKGKRPQMGRIAAELSDFVVVTSDNPRSENPYSIMEDICDGIDEVKMWYEQEDCVVQLWNRREAIYIGLLLAQEGDVVVIAGKGHEKIQEWEDVTEAFDDVEVAKELLEFIAEKQPVLDHSEYPWRVKRGSK